MTLLVIAVALSAGCPSRKAGLCEKIELAAPKPGDLGAAESAANAAYAERIDVVKLRQAIGHWREAVAISPKKTENYVKLSRALYFLGDGYQRLADEEDEMADTLEEATYFAEKALDIQNEDFRNAVCGGEDIEDVVDKLTKEDVAAVYWYSTALSKWSLATSIVTAIKNKDRIYAMMGRIRELEPDYWYGAVDRYLGAFRTKIPWPGGDEVASLKHFKASLAKAPNYLATHVLMASMLSGKWDDEVEGRKMFVDHLQFVLDAPDDIIPELIPEHRLEKQKAKRLMEELDDRF
jgi:tetratricopeptide (TPR) repeat protein